jgi:RNA 3'-terminal phosphate cyclase (ATP)
MSSSLHIDGSSGEGGGQILRSSLTLALITGRAVTIERIRAGRARPGLMRQHLTSVGAATEVCNGLVHGAEIGSGRLTFVPGPVRAGNYRFNVGSAGSATLVLQTVLPPLLIADGPSRIVVEGGTHNPWAPPFDFLRWAYMPLINRMGPQVELSLDRPGYYPAGGGRLTLHVQPAAALTGFDLLERGKFKARRVRVLLSNLPQHIAQREIDTILKKTSWRRECCAWEEVPASGPGNVVSIELESEQVTEVFTGFGRVGVRAERVAAEALREARDYEHSNVPVGPHLADQLLLPLGISAWQPADGDRRRGGSFRTLTLTAHATTHIDVLRAFLGVSIAVETSEEDQSCLVRIGPPE